MLVGSMLSGLHAANHCRVLGHVWVAAENELSLLHRFEALQSQCNLKISLSHP